MSLPCRAAEPGLAARPVYFLTLFSNPRETTDSSPYRQAGQPHATVDAVRAEIDSFTAHAALSACWEAPLPLRGREPVLGATVCRLLT